MRRDDGPEVKPTEKEDEEDPDVLQICTNDERAEMATRAFTTGIRHEILSYREAVLAQSGEVPAEKFRCQGSRLAQSGEVPADKFRCQGAKCIQIIYVRGGFV